jgi:glycerol-3-phosphate dehydrogenase
MGRYNGAHWEKVWKDKIIHTMATVLKWGPEQKRLLQNELEKHLNEANTAVDEEAKQKVS